jgi:hypothetical protein
LSYEAQGRFHASMKTAFPLLTLSLLVFVAVGCRSVDPAAKFIARVDHAPPDRRPKGWENIKAMMSRTAPGPGQPAPDFTLPLLDGTNEIKRATHQGERPLMLIFASFT